MRTLPFYLLLIMTFGTFIALGFGERLTHKYDTSVVLFLATVLTFIGGQWALSKK